jgi:cation diffusion facilitator CzcD-associated flavoprotein CzcO
VITRDVVVIGAGPSGLCIALGLRDRGLRPMVIDRADEVGSSWRRRYDHAREDGIELRLGTEVTRLDRETGGWCLATTTGDISARQVVIATG